MPRRARAKPAGATARRARAALVLGDDCTLRAADELKSRLLEASAGVQLDGTAVQRIDSAGLQLLAALALREQAAGRRLEWRGASVPLRASSARAGLATLLALDPPDRPS